MKILYVLIILLFFSCEGPRELLHTFDDLTPPSLISIKTIDEFRLEISCNEDILLKKESIQPREDIDILSITNNGNSTIVEFSTPLLPEKEYCSEFRIEDLRGNYLSFIAKYYGYNPNLPKVLINEFICRGTDTNPDKIELYIIKGGNLGGVALFNGVSSNYDSLFIFPKLNVNTGDYIVVRSTSKRYPTECIETDSLDIDNDKKFLPGIRDIRTNNLKLSGSNGVITLYSNPFGELLDSVIYTKNLNDPEKSYRNFGLKKTVNRVDIVAQEKGWIGDIIFPENVVNIDHSTTTRSVNRTGLIDSNSKEDWHIVPTKGSTFGFKNNDDIYMP